jgi:hypothetical protein
MKKISKRAIQVSMLALSLSSAACGQVDENPPANEPEAASEPSPQAPEPDMNNLSPSERLDLQVSGAIADAATRAGVSPDAITIAQARIVQWGSSALGCPREGMNYTQAMVPGILVLLEADGKIYRYHGQTDKSLFYCPDDRAQAPAFGPGEEFR